jgi:hypothetical protein
MRLEPLLLMAAGGCCYLGLTDQTVASTNPVALECSEVLDILEDGEISDDECMDVCERFGALQEITAATCALGDSCPDTGQGSGVTGLTASCTGTTVQECY